MRRLFFLILMIIAGAGGYWLYKNPDANKMMRDARDRLENYPAAKTPEEAAEFFAKAIKERDYDRAAAYCTRPYGDQLLAAAKSAKELGNAIDGLMNKLKTVKIANVQECRIVLWMLDPFPREGMVIKVTKDGDLKAKAAFAMVPTDLGADRAPDSPPTGYSVNQAYIQSLYKNLTPVPVLMVREQTGDKVMWKFDFTPPPNIAQSVKILNEGGPGLAEQISSTSASINRDSTVKEDFISYMKEMLRKWAQ